MTRLMSLHAEGIRVLVAPAIPAPAGDYIRDPAADVIAALVGGFILVREEDFIRDLAAACIQAPEAVYIRDPAADCIPAQAAESIQVRRRKTATKGHGVPVLQACSAGNG